MRKKRDALPGSTTLRVFAQNAARCRDTRRTQSPIVSFQKRRKKLAVRSEVFFRKSLTIISILFIFLTVCGCREERKNIDEYSEISDYFAYNIPYDSVCAMTSGTGAELFAAESTDEGIKLRRYGADGEMIAEFSLNYSEIYDITRGGNFLYIAYGSNRVDKLDIKSGKCEFVCDFPKLSEIRSIAVIGDEIAALGKDNSKQEKCAYLWNGSIEVENKRMGVFIYRDGAVRELETPFVSEIAQAENGIIIYGCDNEQGYYFREYKNGALSEANYTDQLGKIKTLYAFGENGWITSSVNRINLDTLLAGNISGSSAAEIMPNVYIFGDFRHEIVSNSAFCWYLNDNSKEMNTLNAISKNP